MSVTNPYGAVPNALHQFNSNLVDLAKLYLQGQQAENENRLSLGRLALEQAGQEAQLQKNQLANAQTMFQLGIQDAQQQEAARHNQAYEGLQGQGLEETQRSNIANEGYKDRSLEEAIRSNQSGEGFHDRSLDETIRHNKATEGLTLRSLSLRIGGGGGRSGDSRIVTMGQAAATMGIDQQALANAGIDPNMKMPMIDLVRWSKANEPVVLALRRDTLGRQLDSAEAAMKTAKTTEERNAVYAQAYNAGQKINQIEAMLTPGAGIDMFSFGQMMKKSGVDFSSPDELKTAYQKYMIPMQNSITQKVGAINKRLGEMSGVPYWDATATTVQKAYSDLVQASRPVGDVFDFKAMTEKMAQMPDYASQMQFLDTQKQRLGLINAKRNQKAGGAGYDLNAVGAY